MDNIIWFESVGIKDINHVGGKIASLGELINHLQEANVKVPGGFATTAQAFRDFLQQQQLSDQINEQLAQLDPEDLNGLANTGKKIRDWIMNAPFSRDFENEIAKAYEALKQKTHKDLRVAVRSSATAEDLPDASFAGQQETFLNVASLKDVISSIKSVYASLYNDRAISYRVHHQFKHEDVAIAVGIQQMVRSDIASSGVMFTIDTESGFDQVILITATYGLGEAVVQGSVNPDEFYIYKPNLKAKRPAILKKRRGSKELKLAYADDGSGIKEVKLSQSEAQKFSLTDDEIETLARLGLAIEEHYQRPMDIEWAKDGDTGEIYIVQARPETVKSLKRDPVIERYILPQRGKVLATGQSIGQKIGQGPAKVILDLADIHQIQAGDVLVTDMTDPDWEPIMKKAAAIVTNRGGRTCHAAIIARELGIPAIVGCGDATETLANANEVTVSCAEGECGFVYDGKIDFEIQQANLSSMPDIPFKIMLNVGSPERAFDFHFLPNAGVGLARLEFIINNMIGIHPNALLNFDSLTKDLQNKIADKIAGYESPTEYYIERLKEGIATIAASFYPKPVIVRFSDFKSNEYANLLGGKNYEPIEDNPMLGFRGASRYIDARFKPAFEMEIEAIKRIRNKMQLDNVWVMIPFVRTLKEAKSVIELLQNHGLSRRDGLKIIMMCEIPSNVLLADQFLEYFDGFSIGSNDLTQLTLGVDRDSGILANLFDERDPAIKLLLENAIKTCKKHNKYIGICGQGPSDHLDFAKWLADTGIESISLNPDTVISTWLKLA